MFLQLSTSFTDPAANHADPAAHFEPCKVTPRAQKQNAWKTGRGGGSEKSAVV